MRARGARTGRRTRGPSERTAVGGLSRAAAASPRYWWEAVLVRSDWQEAQRRP